MSRFVDAAFKQLKYAASLPERTIRSLAAVAGGTSTLLTEVLFPEPLRGTSLYKIFLGDAQRFMIEKIARIQQEGRAEAGGEAAGADYVQRKMVGGALETAGLFAMHLSPLWVMAMAGDAAVGTRVFIDRLTNQLKSNGVLPLDAKVDGLAELLGAIQETARTTVTAMDTPPLSREEMNKLAAELKQGYGQVFAKATDLVPRLEAIWERLQQLAGREKISLERLSGIVTVDAASWAKKGLGAVLAVGQTGFDLFGEQILDSYARTLDAVADQGVEGYLRNRMAPFLAAAAAHFDAQRKTWTDELVESLLGRTERATTDSST